MTRSELRRFKKVLENMKEELTWALQISLDRLVVSQSADPMDQIREFTEQDLDSRNISLLVNRLGKVTDALRAIREENFGVCASCEGEIAPRRLEAVPWSSYCIACQQATEARAGGKVPETAGGKVARAR